MKEIDFSTSACRHCRFYSPEGRRGGSCQKLNVPVRGSWKACTFASSPFETTLNKLEHIFYLDTSKKVKADLAISSTVAKVEIDDGLQATVSPKSE